MRIEIFDVEHGQCAAIYCPPSNTLMLIDAGHNTTTGWRPSQHFARQTIETLVISNYDEDHASDVHNLTQTATVKTLSVNLSISSRALYDMKAATGGMRPGVQHLHDWLRQIEFSGGGPARTVDIGNVRYQTFSNPYPLFDDANNLSVATFVEYAGFKMLFPGDLEVAGWQQLWRQQAFRDAWNGTNVLLASHHGRENGCFEDMFRVWQPAVVLISDSGREFSTQDTQRWYTARTTGCRTTAGNNRNFITTRSDGKITIDIGNNAWSISTNRESRANATSAMLGRYLTGA